MSRSRTGPQVAADTAPHRGHALLVELLFTSGTLRLCLGPWAVLVGADTYVATGTIMQVDAHGEAADGTEGLRITVSGLAAGVFDLVVTEAYQRRLVRVLEQRYDAADAAVGAPSVEFIGRMIGLTSTESPADRTHTVVLDVEHFDAEGRRARNIRFTDAEQRRRYPSDLGAEYAAALEERVLTRAPL